MLERNALNREHGTEWQGIKYDHLNIVNYYTYIYMYIYIYVYNKRASTYSSGDSSFIKSMEIKTFKLTAMKIKIQNKHMYFPS